MAGAALLALLFSAGRPASAFSPVGACCLPNGSCEDTSEFGCDKLGGEFVDAATTCAMVNCAAPVAAPLVSIFGLVAVVGAMGGLGVYRLVFGRSR